MPKPIPRSATGLILVCNACDVVDEFCDKNSAGYCQKCWKETVETNSREGIILDPEGT